MSDSSRRAFLIGSGSAAIAVAGVAAAGPAQALRGARRSAPAHVEIPPFDGQILMYVKDARRGDIAVLVGDREIVVRDRRAVARFITAARG